MLADGAKVQCLYACDCPHCGEPDWLLWERRTGCSTIARGAAREAFNGTRWPDAAPTRTADGRRLWLVGGYNLKQTQVERLQSGAIVVSDRVADEVVAELCGEELRHGLHRGRGRQRWAQTRDRVEASDCLTYAIACWRSVVDVGAAA